MCPILFSYLRDKNLQFRYTCIIMLIGALEVIFITKMRYESRPFIYCVVLTYLTAIYLPYPLPK